MKFGENLYNLRKRQHISQEKLAEEVEVSRQSVSRWENGTAYPEMNRILKLCKIFHCQLNDLVNDTILDFNSLDKEVKMSVVKFNQTKQRNLKIISKIISICAKILQIGTTIISATMLVAMFFVPSIVHNLSVQENNIAISPDMESIQLEKSASEVIEKALNEHSRAELSIYAEIIIFCLIISIMTVSCAMMYLSKLFKNISKEETPFTLDNLKYIKIVTILLIVYLLFPDISGGLFQLITKIDVGVNFEIAKIFYILIIVCVYYIFDYGHQIQLDSKGKIYGKENE